MHLWSLLLACRAPSPLPEGPRTVVWVSMDTVRADATGPAFEALADRGVRFDAAMAPAPTTLASHTSMFTGLYPHHHGVPRNEHRVPEALPTVPRALDRAGYATGAFLGAMPLDRHTGLVRDFDHVDARFERARGGLYEQTERRGAAVTDAALAWLAGQPGHAFAFVHWFDAHQPYTPDQAVAGAPAQVSMDEVLAARSRADGALDDDVLEAMYRAEADQVDREIGRLVAGLDAMGRTDAVLVLVADHGEALAEHSDERWDHGWRVWEETVHVPLVVVGPGLEPRRVEQPVSLVDLGPTVLGLGALPPFLGEGVDLGPLLRGEPLERGPVFSEATKPHAPPDSGWFNAPRWKAAREGVFKLHFDPATGEERLFDLARDPGEQRDLARDEDFGAVRSRLRAALDTWTATADPPPSERVSDAEALEQLRRLGYVE